MLALLQRKGLRDALIVYGGYSFRFISPLLLYPLLTRRLEQEMFGVYVAAYSLALMLSVLVEYGFNLTGTRDVAVAPDAAARGRIASRIVLARLLLLPVALAIGAILVALNPMLREHPGIAAIAILLGCAQGSTAFWYFQAVRKVLVAVSLEVSGQLVALALTFVLVQTPGDASLAISLQLAGFAICAALGVILMFREAPATGTRIEEAVATLRDGFAVFLSRSAVMVYTTGSVFLLSIWAGPVQAALYGAAERVTGAIVALLRPLSSVVLPRMAVQMSVDVSAGLRQGLMVMAATSGLFLILAATLIFAAPYLTPLLFGEEFAAAAAPMQWLAASLPLVAMNTVIGSQIMVALRLDRHILGALFLGGATNLIVAFPLVSAWLASGMAMARLATEAAITLTYFAALKHSTPRVVESFHEYRPPADKRD